MSQPKQTGLFIGGLMIGSAIGTALGLLIAPRTGKETRKVIKKSADALPEIAEDLSTSIQFQADRLSASTLENWEDTLVRLRSAIAAGIETSRESQRLLRRPKGYREAYKTTEPDLTVGQRVAQSDIQEQDLNSSVTDRF